jgi:hypothetical protein
MPELISAEALAKQLGVTGQAVRKAHAAGRLTSFDGKFDPAVARIQWEANRKRRRADAPTRPAEGAGEQTASASSPRGDGSEYSAVPLTYALYRELHIEEVLARRAINSRGDRRGHVPELLVAAGPLASELLARRRPGAPASLAK